MQDQYFILQTHPHPTQTEESQFVQTESRAEGYDDRRDQQPYHQQEQDQKNTEEDLHLLFQIFICAGESKFRLQNRAVLTDTCRHSSFGKMTKVSAGFRQPFMAPGSLLVFFRLRGDLVLVPGFTGDFLSVGFGVDRLVLDRSQVCL